MKLFLSRPGAIPTPGPLPAPNSLAEPPNTAITIATNHHKFQTLPTQTPPPSCVDAVSVSPHPPSPYSIVWFLPSGQKEKREKKGKKEKGEKKKKDKEGEEGLQTTTDPSRFPDISALEKLVAENCYSLPSCEVRPSLKTISDLKQNIENLAAQLISRKKFAFRNEPTKTQTQIPQNDVVSAQMKQNQSQISLFVNPRVIEINKTKYCSETLKGWKVYAGPVTGSILIEEVEDFVLVLASHQIRIHFAKSCDFYLRVRSRSIIEDCNGVRFGPYCLKYEAIEENWGNVDDFKWLRAVQSPNWSVLPEEERLWTVDLADLGCGNGSS
ncbi:hypothetical protein Pint_16727 [Pistacia integerrima]|uniref:Uncharacterized protein n=1 Tax=Pistacia integerrima TaxID=434235 RepID=A0ACC0Z8V6_9ROSI|nr:hypothetical protein Pint_16727 [Pistacia integerrima]